MTNRWIITRLQEVIVKVENGFKNFELDQSSMALYEFAWMEFCDWFIEFSKIPLRQKDQQRDETLIVLHYVLETTFKLLHPIMPFVTEELWLSLPFKNAANSPARERDGKPAVLSLMFHKFPAPNTALIDQEAEITMRQKRNIIEAIRNFRGENNISPKVEFDVFYTLTQQSADAFMVSHIPDIIQLARLKSLHMMNAQSLGARESIIPVSEPSIKLHINLDGLVDVSAEKSRLQKEIDKVKSDLAHVQGKLSKESFVSKAPAALIEKERATEKSCLLKLNELEAALKKLGV